MFLNNESCNDENAGVLKGKASPLSSGEAQTVSNRCQMQQFLLKFSFKGASVAQQTVSMNICYSSNLFFHTWLLENRKKAISSVSIKITSISAKSWTAEKDSEVFVFWLTDVQKTV